MDKFFSYHGLRYHYLDYPATRPDQPTLIFLPGLTANAHCVDGLISAGLNDHARVLALDFRGRGQSDKPATGYSMHEYANDVLGLLQAEGLESAIICGHSFGALIGMVLAAEQPQVVEKFIIVDSSHLLISERTANLIKSSLDRLGVRLPSREVYMTAMKKMPWLNGYWDEQIEAYFSGDVQEYDDGSVQPWTAPEIIAQTIDHEFELDWDSLVGKINLPSWLIRAPGPYGPEGAPPILPAEMALKTVDQLANCEYRETSGNHVMMLFGEHASVTVDILSQITSEGKDAG